MARLWTAGAESGAAITEGVTVSGAITFDTTTHRSPGSRAFKAAGSGTAAFFYFPFTGVATNHYYSRHYIYLTAAPSAQAQILVWQTAAPAGIIQLRLNTDRTVDVFSVTAGTTLATAIFTLPTGAWHRLETHILTNASTGVFEVLWDGVSVYSASNLNTGSTAPGRCNVGWFTAPTTGDLYIDDCGINDNTGTSTELSFPGDGYVVDLLPTADNARNNWVAGAGGTTNLFQGVDNIPPAGVALASGTNTSQIHNQVASSTSPAADYVATMQSYTAGGVGSGDVIDLVQAIAGVGAESTSASTGSADITSNPAQSQGSAVTWIFGGSAIGTFPTGWGQYAGAVAYDPSVTLGTAPTMRVTRRTATSGRNVACCYMAIRVEAHTPAAGEVIVAGTATAATQVTSLGVTTTVDIPAGALVWVAIHRGNVNAVSDVSGISDTHGNTYVAAGGTGDVGQNEYASLWYAENVTAIAAGDVITVSGLNMLASGPSVALTVAFATGMATSSSLDGTPATVATNASPWNTGNVSTSNANDVLFGMLGSNQDETSTIASASSNPASGWSLGPAVSPSGGNMLRTAWQTVAATSTTYHLNGTLAVGNQLVAILAAFALAPTGGGGGSRNVPTSVVAQATSTRTAPTSVVSLSTQVRTVPTSLVALGTSSRTVPTSLVTSGAAVRTVPTSIVALATLTRTVPTAVEAQVVNNTRTVPSSLVTTLVGTRTVPTSLVSLATATRTVPTSAVTLKTSSRTVPTSIVAAGLSRTVPTGIVSRGMLPMPLISQSKPAFASDITYTPGNADDANYATVWRSNSAPSVGSPAWLAYDLSTVPSGSRNHLMVDLLNQQGSQYYNTDASNSISLFQDYKLQGNTAAGGGSAPTTGWVDLITITGNFYPQRTHEINNFSSSGYNWLRLLVTAAGGTAPNNDVNVQMDVHDASLGKQETFLIIGDSITAEATGVHNIDGSTWNYGGWIGQVINARTSGRFWPIIIDGGNGGMTMSWAATNIAGLLANYTGKFVVIAFGTNDCNQSFAFSAGDANVTGIYANLLTVVDACISGGFTVIVPKIPWGSNNGGNLGTNANLVNTYVAAHLPTDRPACFIGPDFWSFFNANPTLIRDGIHPTYTEVSGARSGYEAMIDLYATWMLDTLYLGNQRIVPTSLVATNPAGVRTVPTSVVSSATATRTVPTSLPAQATLTRTAPTSVVSLSTQTRTVSTSLVALRTSTRTVPTSVVASGAPVRSVPTSVVAGLTSVRTVPTSLVAGVVGTRTIATSVVTKATLTRTVLASVVALAVAQRTVPTSLVANIPGFNQPGAVGLSEVLRGSVGIAISEREVVGIDITQLG